MFEYNLLQLYYVKLDMVEFLLFYFIFFLCYAMNDIIESSLLCLIRSIVVYLLNIYYKNKRIT